MSEIVPLKGIEPPPSSLPILDQIAGAADDLLTMLNEMIGTTVKDPPRVKAARAVIEAVLAIDLRLQDTVDRLCDQLQSDGVLVVILDDENATVVIMAGGETIEAEIVDEDNNAPAEDSYCKYCVANKDMFVVQDSRRTVALHGNPYVDLVRGYVGAALVVNDYAVGALCATTDTPRDWTEDEIALLRQEAKEVSSILERALERFYEPRA